MLLVLLNLFFLDFLYPVFSFQRKPILESSLWLMANRGCCPLDTFMTAFGNLQSVSSLLEALIVVLMAKLTKAFEMRTAVVWMTRFCTLLFLSRMNRPKTKVESTKFLNG